MDSDRALLLPKTPQLRKSTISGYSAKIRWVNGLPELASVPALLSDNPQETLNTLLKVYLDVPYEGSDPNLMGLSLGEAIVKNTLTLAAEGDATARAMVFDRVIGKVTQRTETVNVSGTLNDFLDAVAKKHIIDVPSTPYSEAQDAPSLNDTEDL
jgi:hypothetical protein